MHVHERLAVSGWVCIHSWCIATRPVTTLSKSEKTQFIRELTATNTSKTAKITKKGGYPSDIT